MSENEPEDSGLGPMPEVSVEPAEPNPGGPDALPRDEDEVVPADLPIEQNPAVDHTETPTLAEGEDTSTKATRDEDSDDDQEAPA